MNPLEAKKESLQIRNERSAFEVGMEAFGNWVTREDEYSDIVISCRIRLARNLKGYPFPNQASIEVLQKVLDKVRTVCESSLSLAHYLVHEIQPLPDLDKKYLVERRLASPQLIENDLPALLATESEECLSIMVNEEDHLRIQCLQAGLGIEEAWSLISHLDDALGEYLDYSYSSKFGYLTACPTNIGTGLRVSFFAHLPGLALKAEVSDIIDKLPTSEIAVRGFYGEGTESVGDIFQISNQLTLGRTEKNVIARMNKIAQEIAGLERAARGELMANDQIKLEDTIFRAVGILKNARILTSLEAMKLLSAIRLGWELGFIETTNRVELNLLMILIQPAHLQKIYGKRLSAEERDIVRADFVKQKLK
ncbi:protein arginine kinase, partial [bacterium]|nr:protein arginine kinase [bacterium]